MHTRVSFFALVALLTCSSAALAHNHITVDSQNVGNDKPQIVVRAGYQPTETAYTIDSGRLKLDGKTAYYPMTTPLVGGFYDGWFGGSGLTLTSDFYAASGRIDGGDFTYELASITPVSGHGPVSFIWGTFDSLSGEFIGVAQTGAADREDRSFTVGFNSHPHGQGYIIDGSAWVVDVTLIAWDRNGVYTDAAPVTARFDTGECPADFDRQGGVDVADLFGYINAWLAKNAAADFNHDTSVDVADLFGYINAWLVKC